MYTIHSVMHTNGYQIIPQRPGTNKIHIFRQTARAGKLSPRPHPNYIIRPPRPAPPRPAPPRPAPPRPAPPRPAPPRPAPPRPAPPRPAPPRPAPPRPAPPRPAPRHPAPPRPAHRSAVLKLALEKNRITTTKTGHLRKDNYSAMSQAMRLSCIARHGHSVGEMVNLLSVDSEKVKEMFVWLDAVWYPVFAVVLCIGFLWQVVGVAALSGLALLSILILVNVVFLGSKIAQYQVHFLVTHLQICLFTVAPWRVKQSDENWNGLLTLRSINPFNLMRFLRI